MITISLEAAWLANADYRTAEARVLIPFNNDVTAGTITVGAGPGVEGKQISVTIISAVVPDADAPALRAALEAHMLAHNNEARHICVRSTHAGD